MNTAVIVGVGVGGLHRYPPPYLINEYKLRYVFRLRPSQFCDDDVRQPLDGERLHQISGDYSGEAEEFVEALGQLFKQNRVQSCRFYGHAVCTVFRKDELLAEGE